MDYTWDYSDPYEYVRRVQRQEMPPLIITVAITGGSSGKESNPNMPETPEEQALSTYEAYKAGASCVHIHARDETGAGVSTDPSRYREVNKRIREICPDIIIGNTTGIAPWVPREEVVKILDAEPEMCSLNMGPILINQVLRKRELPLKGRPDDVIVDDVFTIKWKEIRSLAKLALERGIKPEMEIWNTAMFWNVRKLIEENLLEKPYWMQLLLSPGNEFPTPEALIRMIGCIPEDSMFSVIGIGAHELPLATVSIIRGGHVRVGFEDNLFYRKGELAKSNAQLVERVVRIARELGREIATPAQAREMLGIPAIPRRY